jgi:hypothetical protein
MARALFHLAAVIFWYLVPLGFRHILVPAFHAIREASRFKSFTWVFEINRGADVVGVSNPSRGLGFGDDGDGGLRCVGSLGGGIGYLEDDGI